ncbi:hypothetical protein C0068_16425 [Zhongshania marina]|uniref:Secreted protein n=1 Tax=Zhongshania marina TaxID=2304603 RepID=A0A2S4HC09_9GAMM|nr:hypothetical protein C0068_16425 [Marortus luteolus]
MCFTNIVISTFTAACLFTIASSSLYAAEKDRNRQAEKLEAKGIETLPIQALMDIYGACLRSALSIEESGLESLAKSSAKKEIKKSDLNRHCQDERKELSKRTTGQFVDKLDDLFEKEANVYLQVNTGKKDTKHGTESLAIASPVSKDLTPKAQAKPKIGREMTDVSAGPLVSQ